MVIIFVGPQGQAVPLGVTPLDLCRGSPVIPETNFNESLLTGVPVSVDMGGAEGIAVVQQRGVDQHVVL